ncbi:DUF5960 family protein [Vaginisenegalia massiliensis]|uniref:DUF5960 family protein n=1 Tax=Vaginisenegalia massiliensis TaxID=2058294 RepID=UPI000F5293AD|nr:DUF5960 family protein [Vaginisenegalia massiliensis]
MENRSYQNNQVQFDYFSENYLRFEEDFYRYSKMLTPLTFLTDDILATMVKGQKNYFKLPAFQACDNRDHYFYFKVCGSQANKLVRTYRYERCEHGLLSSK